MRKADLDDRRGLEEGEERAGFYDHVSEKDGERVGRKGGQGLYRKNMHKNAGHFTHYQH